MPSAPQPRWIYWFDELSLADVPLVGGKNASLGELYRQLQPAGVRVPNGFAVSAAAYRHFLSTAGLVEPLRVLFEGAGVRQTTQLSISELAERGKRARDLIESQPLPADLARAIGEAYQRLSAEATPQGDASQSEASRNAALAAEPLPGALSKTLSGPLLDVAVRSSATAEDLPEASFAGQQESYLNVRGVEAVLEHCRACFASLFTDRAIVYRAEQGFDQLQVDLSVVVQRMVRSDRAAAGVMFTLDPESGFREAVYLTGSYGLGEQVVQGAVNADEWYVYKPALERGFASLIRNRCGSKAERLVYDSDGRRTRLEAVPQAQRDRFCLTEAEVLQLARWACRIEEHYSRQAGQARPMDIEWAQDGHTGELFIVQARPETVASRQKADVVERVQLEQRGTLIAQGHAVGKAAIGSGHAARMLNTADIHRFQAGQVLVTRQTNPDWVPIMKAAAAIVTDLGNSASHAAIVSRELGLPCVVGCEDATQRIADGQPITVVCEGGSRGLVYEGLLPHRRESLALSQLKLPSLPLRWELHDPDQAFAWARYPVQGVGLLHIDSLLAAEKMPHPLLALELGERPLRAANLAAQGPSTQGLSTGEAADLEQRARGFESASAFFRQSLRQSLGQIAAAFAPRRVRVLLSDAPSHEWARHPGGSTRIPRETHPLLGLRGLARYEDLDFQEAADLEAQALLDVRQKLGLTNLDLVFPTAQTATEAEAALAWLAARGFVRGKDGLRLYLRLRTPAQLLQLAPLCPHFDGFLLDVAEVTQLTQGVDHQHALLMMSEHQTPLHPAVLQLIETARETATAAGKPLELIRIPPKMLRPLLGASSVRRLQGIAIPPSLFDRAREALAEPAR